MRKMKPPFYYDAVWYDPVRDAFYVVLYWGYDHFTIDCDPKAKSESRIAMNRKCINYVTREMVKIGDAAY